MSRFLDTGLFSIVTTSGAIGVGWKLNFYVTGTSTRKATYPTSADATAATNANANPVIIPADGRVPPIWAALTGEYKLVLTDENDVVKETIDSVGWISPSNSADLAGTGGAALIGTAAGITVQAFIDSFAAVSDSITVGTGGDYATLVLALDWLKTQPLTRPMTVNLLEKNTPDTAAGNMIIPDTGYTFDNPNSRNLYFTGPAFGGGQGIITNAAMVGTKATDLGYVKSRYPASIRLNGDDTTGGTVGLSFPFGVGGFTRIFFECHNRYNISLGFNASHAASTGQSSGRFVNCAWLGGVWGLIGQDAFISLAEGDNWFGYQISGGPIGMFGGAIETDSAGLQMYFTTGDGADNPKYAIYADGAYLDINSNNTAGKIKVKGSFLNGLYAINGSNGLIMSPEFDGVSQPFTLGNALIRAGTPIITNANPAMTTSVPGATQPGVPGNDGTGALISVGPGGSLAINGATITTSIAAFYIYMQGGQISSYGTVAISGSKATTNAVQVTNSKGNVLSISIGTPQGGSVDQSTAQHNGDVFYYAASGITYNPAINTPTAGSGNYS